MKFTPMADRIAVEVVPEDEVRRRYIVELKGRLDALKGVVVAVGPGFMLPDGTYKPSGLHPGDTVMFAKLAGSDLRIFGKSKGPDDDPEVLDIKILRFDEVMGVVDYEDGGAHAAEFPQEARTA